MKAIFWTILLFINIPIYLIAQDNPLVATTTEQWNKETNAWEFNSQKRNTYSSDQLLLTHTNLSWDFTEKQWDLRDQLIYNYNADRQLINIKNGERITKQREYDENGCLVYKFDSSVDLSGVYSANYSNGKRFEVEADCTVRTIKHYIYYDVDEIPPLDDYRLLDSVFYINQKDSLRRYVYNSWDNTYRYQGPQYNRFDANGQIIEERRINISIENRGHPDQTGTWKKYKRNELGDVIEFDYYSGRRSSMCHHKYTYRYDLTYDDQNRLIQKDIVYFPGTVNEWAKFRETYAYYPCTSLIKERVDYYLVPQVPKPRTRYRYAYLNALPCGEEQSTEILLTPNPVASTEFLNIESAILHADDARLFVFDTAGKLILQKDFPALVAHLNLELLPAMQGLYILHLESSLGQASAKFTVF